MTHGKGMPQESSLARCFLSPMFVVSVAIVCNNVLADERADEVKFFESKIRPVLIEHCYDCHSESSGSAEGELKLDSRRDIRQGGERGSAVVPHAPDESILLKAISHADPELRMPPKEKRLSDQIIADFRQWIERGAIDPRKGTPSDSSETADASRSMSKAESEGWSSSAEDHWAYQPPKTVELPKINDADWPRNELDHFILARLEEDGIRPSPDAQPHVLLRRLYFDLIGLPPTESAIDRFQRSVQQRGVDAAIDAELQQLLDSPQFGERWGRHWLDVARFAESSGKEANISFPYAWRYRDYVIDCFNQDVPYDRFLMEQLAGDLLPHQDSVDRARLLIATGFLALGLKNLDEANAKQFQADVVDEQIDTVSRAILASSIACARCHDHKFDPFSMEDYYALAGIFRSTETYFGTAVSPANRVGGDPLPLPLDAGAAVLHKSIGPKQAAKLREQLGDLQRERVELAEAGKLTLRDALRIIWRSGSIEGRLEKVSDDGEALPLAMGVLEKPNVVDAKLLLRGEVSKPSDSIARGFPNAFSAEWTHKIPADASGRLQLAQWLTDARHPLTVRVMANRVWQHLMGRGLVASSDDFGTTGNAPTHPALLDHLAVEFVANQWSIKQLIRTIVMSRTYRQSSQFNASIFDQDPDCELRWRASKRRLEAELIRDAMLSVSGEIDLDRPVGSHVGKLVGDGPISLVGLNKKLPRDLDGSLYRSIYLPVMRDRLPDVLDVFDFAEPSLVSGVRETTNVPTQALYLMNSEFVRARAQAFAERLAAVDDDVENRIERAYQLCFTRSPTATELDRCLKFFERDATPQRWTDFCQALFCTAEFRNLD